MRAVALQLQEEGGSGSRSKGRRPPVCIKGEEREVVSEGVSEWPFIVLHLCLPHLGIAMPHTYYLFCLCGKFCGSHWAVHKGG